MVNWLIRYKLIRKQEDGDKKCHFIFFSFKFRGEGPHKYDSEVAATLLIKEIKSRLNIF